MTRGHAAGKTFDAPTRAVMPDEGSLEVHLLRHGVVEGFADRVVRGHLDAALSPEGRMQHEQLAQWFARCEAPPDRIVSSDLSRCVDLAQRVSDATGVPFSTTRQLREQSMGDWEGRTWQDLTEEFGPAVNDYWDDYVNSRPPCGESLGDAATRIRAWWEEATAQHDGSRLLLVTHSGVIRILLCEALGLPLEDALRFAPPAASHTRLQLAAAGAVLSGMGERPWLGTAAAPVCRELGAAPRIALSGSAGTGKTTLGRRLAEHLGLPFIEEGMRTRLEAGLDLHLLDHAQLRALLLELWREQCAAEDAATDGFVADRSAADFAAFWIYYGFHHEEAETDSFVDEVLQRLATTDRVLLLPWGVLPLQSDGVRSTNRWVQFMFQSIVEGLLDRHAQPERLLRVPAEVESLEGRVQWGVTRIKTRG